MLYYYLKHLGARLITIAGVYHSATIIQKEFEHHVTIRFLVKPTDYLVNVPESDIQSENSI